MIESDCVLCGRHCVVAGSKARRFCSMACKAEWQRRQKPVTLEWLYQKYVVEGLSSPEIAAIVDRHPKRVWEWLRDLGIPTRPRGGYTCPKAFRPGQPNGFAGRRHTPETRQRLSEIAKSEGRVPYDPDVGSYMKGRSGANTPGWKGGITPERQAFYATGEWREAVKAVWQRDNAICQRCRLDYRTVDRSRVRFTIHHIVGFAVRELRAEPNNLVLLCWPCHRFVHSRGNIARQFLGGAA